MDKEELIARFESEMAKVKMYAIWWHMGFTDQHTDTMSLAAAISPQRFRNTPSSGHSTPPT